MVKVTVNSTGSNRIAITNQNRDTVRTSGVDYTGSSQVAASAFNQANVALSTAQSAFDKANTQADLSPIFNQANAAYDAANTKVSKSGDTVTGTLYFDSATGNTAIGNIQFANGIDLFASANAYYAQLNWNNVNFVYVNSTGSHLSTGNNSIDLYNADGNVSVSLYKSNSRFIVNSNLTVDISGNLLTLGNVSAQYLYGNGAALTGIVTDFSPAFNQANTALSTAQSAFARANIAPDIANSYTNTVGTAGNNYTRTVGTAGNTYTNTVGTAGNNYTRTVGDAGNTYARTVGTAGNTFTVIAFTQANLALSVAQSAFAKANAGSVGISSDTQILYNDASTVSGSSSLTFNKTTNTLGVTNVSVSGTATLNATSIAINSTELNNKSVLVTTTAESIVDQFANTAARSVYYNILANTATEYHTTQITLIHDDVIAYMTEYGTIWTGNSLATFSVSLVGGYIRLNAVSTYANTTYVVFKTVNR